MTDEDREQRAPGGGRFNLNDRERLVRLEVVIDAMKVQLDALAAAVASVPIMEARLNSMTRALWLVAGAFATSAAGLLLAFIFHVQVVAQ